MYEAITSPHHLVNWWPEKGSGRPKLGQEYNLHFTDTYDWYGVVCQIEPLKSFHIKMTKSDVDWDHTVFGFELVAEGDQVHVYFSHKNWPVLNNHFKTASYCWAILLQGLKQYVEKGVIIPFEDRS